MSAMNSWRALAVALLCVGGVSAAAPAFAAEESGMAPAESMSSVADAVTGSIAVDAGPRDVVFTPDGRWAYVASHDAESISKIDVLTGAVVEVIPVPGLTDIDALPDGSGILITAGGLGTVERLDVSTGGLTTVATLGSPSASYLGMRIDSAGQFAYVANRSSDLVFKVDAQTGAVTQLSVPGAVPVAAAPHPDGSVYVAGESGMYKINADGSVEQLGATGAANVHVGPNGEVYFTNNLADQVTVVGVDGALHTIAVGSYPTGIATSPDGKTIYVTNMFDESVSKIDAETRQVIETITGTGEAPVAVAVSPDGTLLYTADYSPSSIEGGTVTVIRTTTTEEVPLIHPGIAAGLAALTTVGGVGFLRKRKDASTRSDDSTQG